MVFRILFQYILAELSTLSDKKYNSVKDVVKELHIIYMGIPA
ncbi:hypothetical protein [Methanosarcina sp. UBA5]|nr:hypothetical protein [Methanosarcina sp. UBA5]